MRGTLRTIYILYTWAYALLCEVSNAVLNSLISNVFFAWVVEITAMNRRESRINYLALFDCVTALTLKHCMPAGG